MEDRLIAAQVGAVSFVDEGTEQVLDTLQELGGVNCLFLASFTYTKGTGGRPYPGDPLPDHGKQEYDLDFFGGNFATAHPEYYRRTFIKPDDFRAREHGDLDIMAEVLPKAHRRGMKVYAWIEESAGKKGALHARTIPNFVQVLEVDHRGRRTLRPCYNHPDYRNWHLGLVEDYIKSYGVDGLAWCSERQGPMGNLLAGRWATGEITCFCEHCRARARENGINVERARLGYLEMESYIKKARQGERPTDGYFVTFWRLLLKYPELLAWESLWHEGQRQMFREMYGAAKAIRREVQVGWHVYHLNSFSPFHRATQDLADMSHYSDFIKLVVYNNCAGARFVDFMKGLHNTIFRDASPEVTAPLISQMLGIDEGDLAGMAERGWSADYVRRETQRALAAVASTGNSTKILPGIDVDVPTGPGLKQTQPEDVHAAVTAALKAGAHGVVLSRKYSEMKLANLAASGRALKELEGGL